MATMKNLYRVDILYEEGSEVETRYAIGGSVSAALAALEDGGEFSFDSFTLTQLEEDVAIA
jgi:hypothetical protein